MSDGVEVVTYLNKLSNISDGFKVGAYFRKSSNNSDGVEWLSVLTTPLTSVIKSKLLLILATGKYQ